MNTRVTDTWTFFSGREACRSLQSRAKVMKFSLPANAIYILFSHIF